MVTQIYLIIRPDGHFELWQYSLDFHFPLSGIRIRLHDLLGTTTRTVLKRKQYSITSLPSIIQHYWCLHYSQCYNLCANICIVNVSRKSTLHQLAFLWYSLSVFLLGHKTTLAVLWPTI